jgi:hypothetical protein
VHVKDIQREKEVLFTSKPERTRREKETEIESEIASLVPSFALSASPHFLISRALHSLSLFPNPLSLPQQDLV